MSMTQIIIYIKSKLYQLIGSTSYRLVNTIVTLMLIPIPALVLFILFVETTTESIFFFVLWTITFYLIVFTLLIVFIKAINKRGARMDMTYPPGFYTNT